MCLVYLAGQFSDPFALQWTPKAGPGERSLSGGVLHKLGRCDSLPAAPGAAVVLLSGEGVHIWAGAWGEEREGGLAEGRSVVLQLQR